MFLFFFLFSTVLTLLDATNEISDFSSFDTETKGKAELLHRSVFQFYFSSSIEDEWRHSLEKGIQTFDRLIINNSLEALMKNHQLENKFEEVFNLTNEKKRTNSLLNNSVLTNVR